MSSLDAIISARLQGVSAVQLDYSDEYPNAERIAFDCGADEVSEVLNRIAELAREREDADRAGNANGDDLDFMWSRIARYASLLPHFVPRFLPALLGALESDCTDLRLFAAQALKLAPSANAIHALQARLAVEPKGPVHSMLEQALQGCRSKQTWVKRLLP